MAIHAHSTPMPAPQRGLLRAFAGCLPALRSAASLVAQPGPLAALASTAAQPATPPPSALSWNVATPLRWPPTRMPSAGWPTTPPRRRPPPPRPTCSRSTPGPLVMSMGEPARNYRRRIFRKVTYREASAGHPPLRPRVRHPPPDRRR